MSWQSKMADKRKALGMTIAELSEASGVPESTINRVLAPNAANGASVDTIVALARTLDMSLDELAGIDPKRSEREAERTIFIKSLVDYSSQKDEYIEHLQSNEAESARYYLYEYIAASKRFQMILLITNIILFIIILALILAGIVIVSNGLI